MEEEKNEKLVEHLKIQEQHKSGSQWFYWIAGLSLINSMVLLAGGEWSFIVGLGMTQIIDAIGLELAKDIGFMGQIIAFICDVIVASIFILFGFFAGKKHTWAFVVGMLLYALDGVLFLLVKDYLSIGFHVFALFCIYNGYTAKKMLEKIDQTEANNKMSTETGTFH